MQGPLVGPAESDVSGGRPGASGFCTEHTTLGLVTPSHGWMGFGRAWPGGLPLTVPGPPSSLFGLSFSICTMRSLD